MPQFNRLGIKTGYKREKQDRNKILKSIMSLPGSSETSFIFIKQPFYQVSSYVLPKKTFFFNSLPSSGITNTESNTRIDVTNISLIEAKNQAEVTDLLKKQEKIRIMVNTGRGFGNQVANVTLINRLRELGYTGKIEIVFQDAKGYRAYIAKNLARFFPDFNPNDPKRQVLRGNVEIMKLPDDVDCHDLDFVPIGLTGADDFEFDRRVILHQNMATTYNTGLWISLNPTNWVHGRSFYELGKDETYKITKHSALFSESDSISPQISADDEKLLKEIESSTVNNNYHFQLIYGLYPETKNDGYGNISSNSSINPTNELYVLCKAILQANFDKPVVLFTVSTIDEYYYLDLLSRLVGINSKEILWINDSRDFPRTVKNNPDTKIILCREHSLNKTTFDSLLRLSTLPPVVEGCNSVSFLETRRPFLHGGWPDSSILQVPNSILLEHGLDSEIQTQFFAANQCLEKGDHNNISALTTWLQMVDNNDPRIKKYHEVRKTCFMQKPDMVATALYNARKLDFPQTIEAAKCRLIKQLHGMIKAKKNRLEEISVTFERLAKLSYPEKIKLPATFFHRIEEELKAKDKDFFDEKILKKLHHQLITYGVEITDSEFNDLFSQEKENIQHQVNLNKSTNKFNDYSLKSPETVDYKTIARASVSTIDGPKIFNLPWESTYYQGTSELKESGLSILDEPSIVGRSGIPKNDTEHKVRNFDFNEKAPLFLKLEDKTFLDPRQNPFQVAIYNKVGFFHQHRLSEEARSQGISAEPFHKKF